MKPRTLHVCNLANVAYGYAKILREFDYPVALRCHDLQHLMSQPEWEDLELSADDFPNENDFFDNVAQFGNYRRPDWFRAESILPLRLEPDAETAAGQSLLRRNLAAALRTSGRVGLAVARRTLPIAVKTRLYPLLNYVNSLYLRSSAPPDVVAQYRQFERDVARQYGRLIAAAAQYGPEWAINRQMLVRFQPHAWWLRRHAGEHDAVLAYVLAPIYAMLLEDRPWIGIEIGTMRDIPFDGTDIGRLLALAYRRAPHVLITNPDVVKQADRLGVTSYSFCPHPLDESHLVPAQGHSSIRQELQRRYGADLVLFAPARQNWAIKGNDRYFRAYAELIKQGTKAVLVIPGWGQEIERSKRLCRELGIAERVEWVRPQSEKVLAKYYQAADLVLDQFVLGVFGLTTPKAMACGAIVLTSYDPGTHAWCFPEPPPLVACRSEQEIYQAMVSLAGDPLRRQALARASRSWVCQYHSKRVIRRVLDDAVGKARAAHERQRHDRAPARRAAVPARASKDVLLLAVADDFRVCRHALRVLKEHGADVHATLFDRQLARLNNAGASGAGESAAAGAGPQENDYALVWRWSVDAAWRGTLARYSRRYRDVWAVEEHDIDAWASATEHYAGHYFGDPKVLITIGRAAIPALIAAARPYVAIEIGTSVPVDPADPEQRLQLFAYREAPVLVVAEPNAYRHLRGLGLDRAHYLPLPLESAFWDPTTHAERELFRASVGAGFTVYVPLAQDWTRYALDGIIRGFARFHERGEDRDAVLLLLEEGVDAGASRALVAQLGLASKVRWIRADLPCDEARLYRCCNVVVDSLDTGTSSPVNIERAAACATAIVGAFDAQLLESMYGGLPPVHRVSDAETLADAFEQIFTAPAHEDVEHSALARWYREFGSVAALRDRLTALVAAARNAGIADTQFHALCQKRLELRYESASVQDYDRKYHASAVYRGMDRRLADLVATAAAARADVPLRLLDLGCGPGSLIPYLRRIPGAVITGVDLSPEMIRYAREHYPDAELLVGDAESIQFDDDTFDVVLCSGMLHHLPRIEAAMREIRRVLKPGGLLIAREPNEDNFAARHGETAFAHLCLRHHLYAALGRRPIAEPEAHDYHHDFDLPALAGAVGTFLRVENVHTDLRVGYFYELLASDEEFAVIDALEQTLGNQPGLNIVVVARKEPETGVATAAQVRIDGLVAPAGVEIAHFRVLADTLRTMADTCPGALTVGLERFHAGGWTALLEAGGGRDRVAVIGTSERVVDLSAVRIERLLAECGVAGTARLARRVIGAADGSCRGGFDLCIAVVDGELRARDLRAVVDCVADYGLLVVEVAPGTTVTGAADELASLRAVPVLAEQRATDGGATVCVSPSAYTLLDAVKALQVAVDVESQRGAEYPPAALAALRASLAEIKDMLAQRGTWSHLGALEQGRNLLVALSSRARDAVRTVGRSATA
ncbi:MAG: methyltransferase domain-containing protein [Gammaproteobacteria bacterium]|nr:methyltransferase domain-containing protein [Gammaproteobacteria bacterium]